MSATTATTDDALRVLVVDDEPATALLLASILERDGVDVDVRTTAEEARELLAQGARPDVVLSDLVLPGEDGIDLCAWVRSSHVDPNVPVLLVSSAAERATRLRALDEGADDLLSKPVDPIELRARVRSLARLSRARASLAARERIDAVLAEVSDAVVLVDAKGAMRDANARAQRLLDLPGDADAPVLAHLERAYEVVEDHVATADGARRIVLHRRRIDTEPALWLEVRVLEVQDDPNGGLAIVARDISDERAAQALADVVLSSVAHKLRTPMTGIVAVADSLGNLVDEGPAQILVGVLRRSASRLDTSLARIIEHAAAVSRGEDDLPVVLRPGRASDILRHLVAPPTIGAVAELTEALDRPVRVALGPLVAALDEYVDNARAAGDQWPAIHLATVGANLEIRVEDRGTGFAPEEADRLFHAFHQEDRTGQDPRMGLGLPLVRALAARAGGTVSASSPPAGVTTFVLTLPCSTVDGDRPGDVTTPMGDELRAVA